MSKEIANTAQHEIAVRLNESVLSVLGAENVIGFEKSFQIANAMGFLKENLTEEVMKPIMAMQGSKLGFKSDKDNQGGYPLSVVKDCLIDAALTGVNAFGNQFNIIGGNMYVTKEGYGELLKKVTKANGLRYVIKHSVPQVDASKTFATVDSTVKWIIDGVEEQETLTFSIKGNAYATSDAYTGKAERKARAWLFNQVSDIEVSDGDVEDIEVTVVSSTTNPAKPTQDDIELVRLKEFLSAKIGEDLVTELTEEEVQNLSNVWEALNELETKKAIVEFSKKREYTDAEKSLIKARIADL